LAPRADTGFGPGRRIWHANPSGPGRPEDVDLTSIATFLDKTEILETEENQRLGNF
jgi:hypothetical protein